MPATSPVRLLAALSLGLPLVELLLCGLGFVWSLFFDLPGHNIVALVSVPSLITALPFTLLICRAGREDRLSCNLARLGAILQILVVLIFLSMLVVQSWRSMSESMVTYQSPASLHLG